MKKTVNIEKETWERLSHYKINNGAKTFDEAIQKLLDEVMA